MDEDAGLLLAVLDAGWSSLKFTLYEEIGDELSLSLKGRIEGLGTEGAHFSAVDPARNEGLYERWSGKDTTYPAATRRLLRYLYDHLDGRPVDGVGHRILYGGTVFTEPARLDSMALQRLDSLAPQAPLHLPHDLDVVRVFLETAPDLPQVGCFETAFHAGQPPLAQKFAPPGGHGFHGLSYEYVARMLPSLAAGLAEARVIVARLDKDSSLCALEAGRGIGFTAIDGPPCDDLFVYRLAREIGSLAAALGGLDALVFTAGLGEHSASIRQAVCEACAWLGLSLDAEANRAGAQCISTTDSRVSAWVVPTDEDLMIARHTRRLIQGD